MASASRITMGVPNVARTFSACRQQPRTLLLLRSVSGGGVYC
eukprot:COSAG05_NODE_12356_length_471_cov_0.951613_1_plen_41_part_10